MTRAERQDIASLLFGPFICPSYVFGSFAWPLLGQCHTYDKYCSKSYNKGLFSHINNEVALPAY